MENLRFEVYREMMVKIMMNKTLPDLQMYIEILETSPVLNNPQRCLLIEDLKKLEVYKSGIHSVLSAQEAINSKERKG